jgi:hypothetical protein
LGRAAEKWGITASQPRQPASPTASWMPAQAHSIAASEASMLLQAPAAISLYMRRCGRDQPTVAPSRSGPCRHLFAMPWDPPLLFLPASSHQHDRGGALALARAMPGHASRRVWRCSSAGWTLLEQAGPAAIGFARPRPVLLARCDAVRELLLGFFHRTLSGPRRGYSCR